MEHARVFRQAFHNICIRLACFFPNLCNNPLRQNDFVAFFESCSSPRKHKGIIIMHYVYMFSLLKRISKDLIVWQKY